uniref:Chromosome 12 open reading frame 50 n=1 Tax=Podarcis muralis TaxID=64176 RepID=A0A670IQT8_PODMU
SCVFHHRKPRNINGLFLPPSNDSTLQREVQEGILPPAQNQDSTKGQESTLRPIHPPLIITINLEDDDEEEQEEKYASYLLSKTPEDIEEEKAIKEMCYKSGEYYRIQTSQENHLTKNIPLVLENELLKPMETGRDLQEGDGVAVPSKFNIAERQTEITASLDCSSRSDLSAFENGGGDCYLPQRNIFVAGIQRKAFNGEKEFAMLKCSNIKGIQSSCIVFWGRGGNWKDICFFFFAVCKCICTSCLHDFSIICAREFNSTSHAESIKKHHFKGVKKKKWISEEPKNLPLPLTAKAMHTSNPKGKGYCQQNDQSKNAENASYVPSQRASGRSISLSSPAAARSPNLTYGKIGATKESKMNLAAGEHIVS